MGIMQIENKKVNSIFKVLLLVFAFSLAILRTTPFLGLRGVICDVEWITTSPPCVWKNVSIELLLWALALIILIVNLFIDDHGIAGFLTTCKKNWLIFAIVLLTFISLLWTIQFEITLYKASVLLIISLIALYIGYSFPLDDILKILVLFYVFLCTLNLIFVLLFLPLGVMPDPFYQGAWRGIFWHRNYLGTFMALGVALFMVNLLAGKKSSSGEYLLNLVMLALSTFLLIKSKNATGEITAVVLVGLVFIMFFWLKWRHKLKQIHYYGFVCVALAAVTFVSVKLDFFLGLFGRNSSLTGRTPMWGYLLQNIISQRPWLGYGYGAIWHMEGFLEEVERIVNWGVGMGDNGYIDILLHLGVVGLIAIIGLIVTGMVRGVKFFLRQNDLQAAFPVLLLVFLVLANITFSLILESETFYWMLAIALLVSIASRFTAKTEVEKLPESMVNRNIPYNKLPST